MYVNFIFLRLRCLRMCSERLTLNQCMACRPVVGRTKPSVEWVLAFCTYGKAVRGVMSITDHRLAPKLRMSVAVPLFPVYDFGA